MWAISRGKSCHRIFSLWKNGSQWLISEFLLESKLLSGMEGSSLLVHAFTTLFVFSLFVFPFTLPFSFLISILPLFFLIFLLLFFLIFSYLLLSVISCACLSSSLPTVHSQGPFILTAVIGFTILPLNYFCLGVGVLPKPPTGLSIAQPSPLPYASSATFHS